MARKPRLHFLGALYHVIVRGNRGQRVFLGRKLWGYSWSSIADYFRRDPVSLCQGIAKVD